MTLKNRIKQILMIGTVTWPIMVVAESSRNREVAQGSDQLSSVTGTRLKRANAPTALPLRIISREEVLRSGHSNTAELIRSIAQNIDGSYRSQSGSSLQSTAAVDVRGLGSRKTLLLMDGRRIPNSPRLALSADLNLLPLAFIERIEVLSQTATAIYGDQASAGVINVITRQGIQGMEVSVGGAEVSVPAQGGEREMGSLLFGVSNERSQLTAGVAWNDREIIFDRDLPWTEPGASSFSNNFRHVGFSGDEQGPFIPVVGGCAFPDSGFYLLETGSCAYDFTRESADESSVENQSFYVRAKHQINDNWLLWTDAHVFKTTSFGRYAPVPEGSGTGLNLRPLTVDSINNPSNPLSPHHDPDNFPTPRPVHWRHRFDALGNRDNEVNNQWSQLATGLQGSWGGVDVELGVSRAENRSVVVGRNFLLRSAAGELIENGSYILSNPYQASSQVLNSLRVTISRDGRYDQNQYFANITFQAMTLPAGPVLSHVGLAYRQEDYADLYDSLSEANQVGGSSGNSAVGSRNIGSAYFETLVPVLNKLELNLAGRYEDFSDLGGDFSQQAALRYQPTDQLTVRGSFNGGTGRPPLRFMNQNTGSGTSRVNFPINCFAQGLPADCRVSVTYYTVANPNLQPETYEHYGLGLSYQPFNWMAMDLDYYELKLDQDIRLVTSQQLLADGLFGDTPPVGLGCQTSSSTGEVFYCNRGYANRGSTDLAGIDYNLRFNYPLLGVAARTQLIGSHTLENKSEDGLDLVALNSIRTDRAVLSHHMTWQNWQLSYHLNWVGGRDRNYFNPDDPRIPSWVTHDVQLSYHTSWQGQLTVGAQNLHANLLPLGVGNVGNRDYDFNLYDGFGRIFYAKYTQSF